MALPPSCTSEEAPAEAIAAVMAMGKMLDLALGDSDGDGDGEEAGSSGTVLLLVKRPRSAPGTMTS